MRHKEDVTRYAPGFATFLDRSPDFLTYRYRLRPDIFWHTPALDDDEELVWLTNGESCREVGARTAAYLKKTSQLTKMLNSTTTDIGSTVDAERQRTM